MTRARTPAGLYVLTDALVRTPGDLIGRARAVLEGGARVLQYRDKSTDTRRRLAEASALRDCCQAYDALFIVNDDVLLAEQVGADGLHLGEHDTDVATARARLGPGCCLGASCYGDLERAARMLAAGADYLAFGAVFRSSTKPDARTLPAGRLAAARRQFSVPLVAIGGIDAGNVAGIVAIGVEAAAVSSAVFSADDPASAARALVTAIDGARR
jgi:thiamine-phosphate pyrophosphorylase